MLHVCIKDVMEVVFSVCIVARGPVRSHLRRALSVICLCCMQCCMFMSAVL